MKHKKSLSISASATVIEESIYNNRYIQFLVILTIIGAFLRFYNIGLNSLWLDEASTYSVALLSVSGIWGNIVAGEFNPPLFYWIEHFIILFFGNSEFNLRIVPCIFGTLTIPAIYYAGKEFMDKNVGIIAATLMTFSIFLIFYSQEARAYSMMLFFITVSMIFYFRALRDNDIKDWGMFGICSAISFWTHFYALVIIGSLILYAVYHVLLVKKTELKPFIYGCSCFGMISLPLMMVMFQLFLKRTASAPTFGIQGPSIIIATFDQISGNMFVTYIFMLLFIIGCIQAFAINKEKGFFLVMTTIMIFVISSVLSYMMPMMPRYLIFFSIIYFIAMAMSYRFLANYFDMNKVIYCIIILIMLINVPALMNYYAGYTKSDWRGLSSDLQNITQDGDIVAVVPNYMCQPLNYYYSNTTDNTIEMLAITSDDLKLIDQQKGNHTVFYVVTGDIVSANPNGDSLEWFGKNTKILLQRNDIYVMIGV